MGLEGLGHVVVGAEGQAATVVPVVPAGGQDYHGDAGPSAHLAQHLETVQAREHEVEHHEVGGGIRKGREEVLPRREESGVEPVVGEKRADKVEQLRIVVDYADRGHGFPRAGRHRPLAGQCQDRSVLVQFT